MLSVISGLARTRTVFMSQHTTRHSWYNHGQNETAANFMDELRSQHVSPKQRPSNWLAMSAIPLAAQWNAAAGTILY